MNSLKNDVKTIMENQKHVIAEILGMKTRIEALERLDFNKDVTMDIVVADLVNQKRLIHDKLVQVDRSINYLNYKLQESEKIHEWHISRYGGKVLPPCNSCNYKCL